MIGTAAGSSPMYQAMTTLGLAAGSTYKGPIRLEGDPKGASVLILGAGIAGLVAALELHKIGYQVQVLEYNDQAGGRCWSLRGGASSKCSSAARPQARRAGEPAFQAPRQTQQPPAPR
jgi:monoamine oxidase